jgi:hypothetical protein
MPPEAPTTLRHRGQLATLPARFDHATATYLLSLLDYEAASGLCAGENFDPLPMLHPRTGRQAVGFVAAVDYHQTDVGAYREWILGIWVWPRGGTPPGLRWVNPASLAFYGVLAGDRGFTFFSPKMILTEALPTEVGVEHYGIPKELGRVSYERSRDRTRFEVGDAAGRWVLKAAVPTSRGPFARWGTVLLLARAFGPGAVVRLALKKELPITLAGSAKLCARSALSVARMDPRAEFLAWDDRDCRLEVNPEAEWGKRLAELRVSPALVGHVPNVAFVLSGPFDQAVLEPGVKP